MFEFWQHYKLKQKEMVDILLMLPVINDEEAQRSNSNALQTNVPRRDLSLNRFQLSEDQKFDMLAIQATNKQRSLWMEMFDEFYYALRCVDRRKRPALKPYCSQCHLLKHVVLQNKTMTTSSSQTITKFN